VWVDDPRVLQIAAVKQDGDALRVSVLGRRAGKADLVVTVAAPENKKVTARFPIEVRR
jgi:hypothetical protein